MFCSCQEAMYLNLYGKKLKTLVLDMVSKIKVGDVKDFNNFMNAVIDEASFDKIMGYIRPCQNIERC